MIDTYDTHSPINPANQHPEELGYEPTQAEYYKSLYEKEKQIKEHKILQLKKLAIIESSFITFGSILFEEQKEKTEILNQYL